MLPISIEELIKTAFEDSTTEISIKKVEYPIFSAGRRLSNIETKQIKTFDMELMTKPLNAQPSDKNNNKENGGD